MSKKILESNFILDEDYKILLLPKEKSSWSGSNKYQASIICNKYKTIIGSYSDEKSAAKAYNIKALELNTTLNKRYKMNDV
jgi:hypothetical protein